MVITIYRPWEKHYSSIGWRIRLALEEKNLKYETRLVVLKMDEHNSEEILRLNPRGELPILQDVDAVLHEESAMLQYVEQYYPEPKLMPHPDTDKKLFSESLVVFHEIIGAFSNVVRPLLIHLINLKEDGVVDMVPINNHKASIMQELTRWEKLLSSHNGEFLMGDMLTLGDIAFFPYLAHLDRYGLPLSKNFPKIRKYFERMNNRSSVKKTYPSGWKNEQVKQWLK